MPGPGNGTGAGKLRITIEYDPETNSLVLNGAPQGMPLIVYGMLEGAKDVYRQMNPGHARSEPSLWTPGRG